MSTTHGEQMSVVDGFLKSLNKRLPVDLSLYLLTQIALYESDLSDSKNSLKYWVLSEQGRDNSFGTYFRNDEEIKTLKELHTYVRHPKSNRVFDLRLAYK